MVFVIILCFCLGIVVFAGCMLHIIYTVEFPYFDMTFDISGRRNVEIYDFIDKFLINNDNWNNVLDHEEYIRDWKKEMEDQLETGILKGYRRKRYEEALDGESYRFFTTRKHTRYRQVNYQRYPYKVDDIDEQVYWTFDEVVQRRLLLEEYGCEATIKEYEQKEQRQLMTPALREKIMVRDHYTCQICGKYMPDEVGLHIDHIIPIAKGGKSVPSNLQVLCSKCNGSKGAKYY